MNYLFVIGGATATGKTATAIAVARHFQAEILSCDSRQFYREMTIGTAKPTTEELATVPHHFINSVSVLEDYTVGNFERDALVLLEKLFQKNRIVVLTGGSGLFIRALCEGLDKFPDVPPDVLHDLEEMLQKEGIAALQKELELRDPVSFSSLDLFNPQRVIRALSVCRASGQPFSSFRQKEKTPRFFQPVYVLLEAERQVLYDRIDRRVEAMMDAGLLDEARQLFPKRHLNALQTVGYQEFFEYFEGKITLQEAVELVQRNSRRYAKRQMTWFRKDDFWKTLPAGETRLVITYFESVIDGFQSRGCIICPLGGN